MLEYQNDQRQVVPIRPYVVGDTGKHDNQWLCSNMLTACAAHSAHCVHMCVCACACVRVCMHFCPRRNLDSVGDYSSSSVGVVCRVVCRVANFKHGIISKRFELEG